VVFTRYDYIKIRGDHFIIGTKALLDALKVRTPSRYDSVFLYYFSAIIDDSSEFACVDYHQECINHPKDAGLRIQVLAADMLTDTL